MAREVTLAERFPDDLESAVRSELRLSGLHGMTRPTNHGALGTRRSHQARKRPGKAVQSVLKRAVPDRDCIRIFMSLPIEKTDRMPPQTKLRELEQQRDV